MISPTDVTTNIPQPTTDNDVGFLDALGKIWKAFGFTATALLAIFFLFGALMLWYSAPTILPRTDNKFVNVFVSFMVILGLICIYGLIAMAVT